MSNCKMNLLMSLLPQWFLLHILKSKNHQSDIIFLFPCNKFNERVHFLFFHGHREESKFHKSYYTLIRQYLSQSCVDDKLAYVYHEISFKVLKSGRGHRNSTDGCNAVLSCKDRSTTVAATETIFFPVLHNLVKSDWYTCFYLENTFIGFEMDFAEYFFVFKHNLIHVKFL